MSIIELPKEAPIRIINQFDIVRHFKGNYYIVLDICQLIPRWFYYSQKNLLTCYALNCDKPNDEDQKITFNLCLDDMSIRIPKEYNKNVSIFENALSSDLFVIYKDLVSNTIWVRKYEEFISEVDHNKYPDVKQKYRFELCSCARKISRYSS